MTWFKSNSIATLMLKRIGTGLVTLWVISLLIFVGVEALPWDLAEAVLGQSATPETVASFRRELKLDLPPMCVMPPGWGHLSGAISATPRPTSGPWST
jgi:ABC-type dipeptide/oligopeptide/nickel transport system permease component